MAPRKLPHEIVSNCQRNKKLMKKASEQILNVFNCEEDISTDEKNDLMYMVIQLNSMQKKQERIINENNQYGGFYNLR